MLDPVIKIIATLILSYVFIVAGVHKFGGIAKFKTTLLNYRLLPEIFVPMLVFLIPVVEVLIGTGLLIPITSGFAALFAGMILALYITAIAINLFRDRRAIDCGCGEPELFLSEWLVLRNILLLLLVVCALTTTNNRAIEWFDWLVVIFATIISCLFYNSGNQLLINKDKLKNLRVDYG